MQKLIKISIYFKLNDLIKISKYENRVLLHNIFISFTKDNFK